MKKLLLPVTLALFSTSIFAQQDFFALTGKNVPQIVFNDFRSLDIKSGTSGKAILSSESTTNVFSQRQNSNVTEPKDTFHQAQATSIATLALDNRGENLFYSPIYSSNIYILDIRTQKITLIENEVMKPTSCSVASQFTRMTAGKDGGVYAMTNSGSQLVKITSLNGNYVVDDLGTIRDITPNNEISLGIMGSGFGGDMVADAEGNLWVISAAANVFKVSTRNLTSEYIGKISGLPEGFLTNGAAVSADGNIFVGSAKGDILYQFDINSLEAKPTKFTEKLHIYDLASKYFLNDTASNPALAENYAGIQIYPTEVKQDFFNINLNDTKVKGNVTVTVLDYFGNTVHTDKMNSRVTEKQIQLRRLNPGAYIVNVSDDKGTVMHSEKILIIRK